MTTNAVTMGYDTGGRPLAGIRTDCGATKHVNGRPEPVANDLRKDGAALLMSGVALLDSAGRNLLADLVVREWAAPGRP